VRFCFRSFDRQWCLPDGRLGDYLRPTLWGVASDQQVFFSTLLSDPLGGGPAISVSALPMEYHVFRGSFGGKHQFALFRDKDANHANITGGLLDLLSTTFGHQVTAEDVAAYVFGLLGTSAFTEAFVEELGTAGAPRVPFTTDAELFTAVVALGRDLLWWSTFGDRFRPLDARGKPMRSLPSGTAKNTKPVPAATDRYPTEFSYNETTQTLTVGAGEFAPVAAAVWEFEVSGLKVVQSWLAYRMKKRAGKASSELDALRPTSWTYSRELLELLSVLEHLVAKTPEARSLLGRVCAGGLIDPALFPVPDDLERAAPSTRGTAREQAAEILDQDALFSDAGASDAS
jgi:hypothetical protein